MQIVADQPHTPAVPMANAPPFAILNHFAADLGIPSESKITAGWY